MITSRGGPTVGLPTIAKVNRREFYILHPWLLNFRQLKAQWKVETALHHQIDNATIGCAPYVCPVI